jgi:hypothetical protein
MDRASICSKRRPVRSILPQDFRPGGQNQPFSRWIECFSGRTEWFDA